MDRYETLTVPALLSVGAAGAAAPPRRLAVTILREKKSFRRTRDKNKATRLTCVP